MKRFLSVLLAILSVFTLSSCVYKKIMIDDSEMLDWFVTNEPVEIGNKTTKLESAVDCSMLDLFSFDLKSELIVEGKRSISTLGLEVRDINTDKTTVIIEENETSVMYIFDNKGKTVQIYESKKINEDGSRTYDFVSSEETYESAWKDVFYKRIPLNTGLFIPEMCREWNISLIKCEDEDDYYTYIVDFSNSSIPDIGDYEYKMLVEKSTGLLHKMIITGDEYSNTITREARVIVPIKAPDIESEK